MEGKGKGKGRETVGHIIDDTRPFPGWGAGRQTLGCSTETVRLATAIFIFSDTECSQGQGQHMMGYCKPVWLVDSGLRSNDNLCYSASMSCSQPLMRAGYRLPCSCHCQVSLCPTGSYRLAKPAFLPLPNRTLVGTN
jgi:hypothetical protein